MCDREGLGRQKGHALSLDLTLDEARFARRSLEDPLGDTAAADEQDLLEPKVEDQVVGVISRRHRAEPRSQDFARIEAPPVTDEGRSEERRVGKECRSRWS